jgi:hypothetical protein
LQTPLNGRGGLMELLSLINPDELGTLMSILGQRNAKKQLPSMEMYNQAQLPMQKKPDMYGTPAALGKGAFYPSRRV